MKPSPFTYVRLPNGTYEVRRITDGVTVATANNEPRAKMLAYTFGEGQ